MIEIAGVEILPSATMFLSFALAGLALNLVPGADMAFVIANSAQRGQRAGIIAALGIGAGAFIHLAAAVAGLSALLASSQAAFNVLKWVGAVYLLYIAVGIMRAGKGDSEGQVHVAADSNPRTFRRAILVNLLNPKVALFFLAFLPQFVDPASPVAQVQILFLGLWFNSVGTLVNILVAIASAATATRLRGMPWVAAIARWIAATAMAGMAIKLAVSTRDRASI